MHGLVDSGRLANGDLTGGQLGEQDADGGRGGGIIGCDAGGSRAAELRPSGGREAGQGEEEMHGLVDSGQLANGDLAGGQLGEQDADGGRRGLFEDDRPG